MTRISEIDMFIPALRIMDNHHAGITTTDLITALRAVLNPSGEDLEILNNRNDDKFSQKVRNIVSHREGSETIITLELAEFIPGSPSGKFRITDEGRDHLQNNFPNILK